MAAAAVASQPAKLYIDDVSLLVVLLDTNPFFWSNAATANSSAVLFSHFLNHVTNQPPTKIPSLRQTPPRQSDLGFFFCSWDVNCRCFRF